MSPTVFQYRHFRVVFFSREETRRHVHVLTPDGEAKFWIDPAVELAMNKGIPAREIADIKRQIEERTNEIRNALDRHFNR